MITKWKVSNFKSIRKEVELDLGKLTVFSGVNSVGKSTLIQSILLAAQSLEEKSHPQSIAMNGDLVKLGMFNDLRSDGSKSSKVTIGFTCKPSTQKVVAKENDGVSSSPSHNRSDISNTGYLTETNCEISFDAGRTRSPANKLQQWPQLTSIHLSGKFHMQKKPDIKEFSMSIHRIDDAQNTRKQALIEADVDDHYIDGISYKTEVDEDSLDIIESRHRSAKIVGCRLDHFIPKHVLMDIDLLEESAYGIFYTLQHDPNVPPLSSVPWNEIVSENSKEIMNEIRKILKNIKGVDPITDKHFDPFLWKKYIRSFPKRKQKEIRNALQKSNNLLNQIRSKIKKSASMEHRGITFTALPERVERTCAYIRHVFSPSLGLSYIGPLRDAPRSLYPPSKNSDPFDLGYRGEETARILELNKDKVIKYMPSSNFKNSEIERSAVSGTLQNAINDWLQYLGIAESIESKVLDMPGHELKVESSHSQRRHNFTQVGIGVSQVLPILVMGLLSREESLLIFEQPEVHLHPKSQVLLGDFFLSMALNNRQCIVESHSEHLVNRLRYRIASSVASDELNDLTKIFFVDKTAGGSSFREVAVNEYGAIVDWPDGFFDQSYNQAQDILLAATAKREANRKKDNGRSS